MTTTKHTRRIHIAAPAHTVFHYIEDPAHIIAAMPKSNDARLGAVEHTPEGLVASYECRYRELGMHLTSVFTREQYLVNQRVVDRSSLGPVFTFSVEPDDDGATLTYRWDASRLMKMLDAVFFHSDKDVDFALATFKREVEALT